jgi:hypothetical protein
MPETNKKVGGRPTFQSDSTLLLKHRQSISPNNHQPLVKPELFVRRNYRDAFRQGLSDDLTVKRVGVVER